MPHRTQTLEPKFVAVLERRLAGHTPEALAAAVLKLSDFYLKNPGAHTPWNEDFAALAYTSYFLPLNLARVRDTLRDVIRFLPENQVRAIWDFGSGLGATEFAFAASAWKAKPFYAHERSAKAVELNRALSKDYVTEWPVDFNARVKPEAGDLAVFSYSFLEMQNNLPPLESFSHLLIVEPSTRERGRELMEWRAQFIKQGFTPLAPCTHVEACPLLTHSQKDWCHFRVHFDAPEIFRQVEEHLPMKNRTLTYSYLLMSRAAVPDHRGLARVIGDTLVERGKTRQLICRGPRREFLSWLHKNGEPPELSSGALIRGTERAESKGGGLELRVRPGQIEEA